MNKRKQTNISPDTVAYGPIRNFHKNGSKYVNM